LSKLGLGNLCSTGMAILLTEVAHIVRMLVLTLLSASVFISQYSAFALSAWYAAWATATAIWIVSTGTTFAAGVPKGIIPVGTMFVAQCRFTSFEEAWRRGDISIEQSVSLLLVYYRLGH
jgi:hypothetical protein